MYKRVTAEQELQVLSLLSAPHITPGNHLKHSMQQDRGPISDRSLPLSLAGCSFFGCTITLHHIKEQKGMDINELFAFELRISNTQVHVINHDS